MHSPELELEISQRPNAPPGGSKQGLFLELGVTRPAVEAGRGASAFREVPVMQSSPGSARVSVCLYELSSKEKNASFLG